MQWAKEISGKSGSLPALLAAAPVPGLLLHLLQPAVPVRSHAAAQPAAAVSAASRQLPAP
jgi:hypothetical protein